MDELATGSGHAAQVCVGAIAIEDDRLLMIQRANPPGAGRWSIPGGRLEPNETVQEAVVRELREETGLAGVCEHLVGWAEVIDDDHHAVILDFAVTLLVDDEPVAGDDALDAVWVPIRDVSLLDLVDGLADFLHEHGLISTIT